MKNINRLLTLFFIFFLINGCQESDTVLEPLEASIVSNNEPAEYFPGYDTSGCPYKGNNSCGTNTHQLAYDIGANTAQEQWLEDNPAVSCFIDEQIDNASSQDKPFVKEVATAYIDVFEELHGTGNLQPDMLNLFDTVCNATVSTILKNKLLQFLPSSVVAIESCMLYNVGKREYQYQRDELGRQKAGAIYWTIVKLHQHAFDRMAEYKDAIQDAVDNLNIQLPQTAEEWEALGGLMISFIAQNWVYLVPVYGDILSLMEEFNTIISTGQVTAGSALNIGASVLGLFPVSKVATIAGGIAGIVVTGVKAFKYMRPILSLGVKMLKVKARARLANGVFSFATKHGDEILQVKNGKILPTRYDVPPINTAATPVGNVQNGYQVVKHGDDISVRRVPDTSGYSQSDLNKLNDHPDAHVLERHGHDVTDDALNKRATEGIAPDGSTSQSGNPPPYSSKFESPDKIKDVLGNVGPGTPNWNPPASGSNYAFDYPLLGNAPSSFGYGIPSGGGSPVSMKRVKIVYKKDGGVWKLFTMYPQP